MADRGVFIEELNLKFDSVGAKIFHKDILYLNIFLPVQLLINPQNFVYYSVVILNHISAQREQGYMNLELS